MNKKILEEDVISAKTAFDDLHLDFLWQLEYEARLEYVTELTNIGVFVGKCSHPENFSIRTRQPWENRLDAAVEKNNRIEENSFDARRGTE